MGWVWVVWVSKPVDQSGCMMMAGECVGVGGGEGRRGRDRKIPCEVALVAVLVLVGVVWGLGGVGVWGMGGQNAGRRRVEWSGLP